MENKTLLRKDWRELPFDAPSAHVAFDLQSPTKAICDFTLTLKRKPGRFGEPLVLSGADIAERTQFIRIDGVALKDWKKFLSKDKETLTISLPEDKDTFTFSCRTILDPKNNAELSGLYLAGDSLFTQCEATGFRRMAWHMDRPDCLSRWTCSIDADRKTFPVMLSNGPKIKEEKLPGGRKKTTFQDPFLKPSYLFAICAGKFDSIERPFISKSGFQSKLILWAAPSEKKRLEFALDSLERAARWDEERFGFEIDLPEYHVVATPDFNAGAMENKGLNIFASPYLLADKDVSTDADFDAVESVVGHEYFHNWTGNRVTVRDWFELTLKEGLTVFRDQEFSAAMNDPQARRVENALDLIRGQFPEDSGPLSHPPRPEDIESIDNLYTGTVYSKGAEVVRIMETLAGVEAFNKGIKLYAKRHDGNPATCEDLIKAVRDATGATFPNFERWWTQAGTPVVKAESSFDEASQTLTLKLSQTCPAQKGQAGKEPFLIPCSTALVGARGLLAFEATGALRSEKNSALLVLDSAEKTFTLKLAPGQAPQTKAPAVSLFRSFSAPVKIEQIQTPEDIGRIAAFETDPWARRSAIEVLMRDCLKAKLADDAFGPSLPALKHAMREAMGNPALSPAQKRLLLVLPHDETVCPENLDPIAMKAAKRALQSEIVHYASDEFWALGEWKRQAGEAYTHLAPQSAQRQTKWAALDWLAEYPPFKLKALVEAEEGLNEADNLTDRINALSLLVSMGSDRQQNFLVDFFAKYENEWLALDKGLSLVASRGRSPKALELCAKLLDDPRFPNMNPSRLYSLFGGLFSSTEAFWQEDGSGFKFLAKAVKKIDQKNSNVAAGLFRVFAKTPKLSPSWAALMRREATDLLRDKKLSKSSREILSKAVKA